MRDATDVRVDRAIVHLINHRKQDLVHSEAELTLKGNEKLRSYFTDQVKNALTDPQTGSAKFSSDGAQSAIRESYKILSGPRYFVPSSQELATLLFTAMGKDARIKPASLAVCVYSASNYPTRFLGLIKIDPTEALIEKVETQNGKRIVNFEVRSDVMPTAREKLQKAALIKPEDKDSTFDLLLLDRQVAVTAANFFAYKFLNSIPTLDPRRSAKEILVMTQNATEDLRETLEINQQEAEQIQQAAEVAFQSGAMEFESWVASLPLPEPAKVALLKKIRRKFPQEGTISFDRDYVQQILLKKRRFRGDYGVLFEVDADFYDEVVRENTKITLKDGTERTRLVIEVPGLQRIW
jgi:hypothetical protein